ncbi:MAG: hypothetical protein IJP14_01020, partial [Clostridia bacterium]|nr:hypothetical protein [Clostridia bacterium]
MAAILYGDGIHDDYAAIQELLDSGICEVQLPPPKVRYLISKTLKIHGGQCLRLPRFAEIMLAPDSNCCMIEDDDFSTWKENIAIVGGIWNMNNQHQDPNPFHFPDKNGTMLYERLGVENTREAQCRYRATLTSFPKTYTGICMQFCRIRNFTLSDLTLRDPVNFGVDIGYIEDFTVENITFDYKHGAPKLWNLDGVHVEGYCKRGVIRNLKGTCHDDLVALTADDGLYGPIENIVVDGIFAENCHSAVRLLSHGFPVRNVIIRNVYGSFYTYCIGITKYHGGPEERGVMENITIEQVRACLCKGTKDVTGNRTPLIWVQDGVDVENLRIAHLTREERTVPQATIGVDPTATVTSMIVDDVRLKNHLPEPVKLLDIQGKVQGL